MSAGQKQNSRGARARNVEARKVRILRSARELLSEDGINGLSMRKLADAAGLSVNTIYNLLGNREDVLDILFADAIAQIRAAVAALPPQSDAIQQIQNMMHATVRQVCSDPVVFKSMIFALIERKRGSSLSMGSVRGESLDVLKSLVEFGQAQGVFANGLDSRPMALQIYFAYEHAVMEWGFGRINATQFEALCLYGLNTALAAIAVDARRDELHAALKALESAI